jgi:hypothetical protein
MTSYHTQQTVYNDEGTLVGTIHLPVPTHQLHHVVALHGVGGRALQKTAAQQDTESLPDPEEAQNLRVARENAILAGQMPGPAWDPYWGDPTLNPEADRPAPPSECADPDCHWPRTCCMTCQRHRSDQTAPHTNCILR